MKTCVFIFFLMLLAVLVVAGMLKHQDPEGGR